MRGLGEFTRQSGIGVRRRSAGTGKATALAPAVDELQAQGRVVFGMASTAAAAEVLATETAMGADTLDKLLHEHTRPDRPPGLVFDLPGGATVIVDEAGTLSTPRLAAFADLAERRGWRVVLVGDPRQFSAVGRGGMFAHLIDTCGAIELDQVHRFANRWEREASLRLRNGDPGVLDEFDRRGRLHDGTRRDMETGILDAWGDARGRGESVALMANTVDTVTRGLVASIGIVKGKPFQPDTRMKELLTDAVAIGNATARAIVFQPRDKATYIYPDSDSRWVMAYAGKDVFFEVDGARNLDARTMFYYPYTAISPAMAVTKPGGARTMGSPIWTPRSDRWTVPRATGCISRPMCRSMTSGP